MAVSSPEVSLVPRPRPSMRERGSGDFSRFSWHFVRFKSCDTCLCACAFQQRARDRETAQCVVPGGGVWVAVTREFERDNCVTSEILQSDWTIPNRAGVPRKSTKVPRPSFVRESREGLGPRLPRGSLVPSRPTHTGRYIRLVTIDAFLGPTRQFGLCNFRNWAPKVRLALLNFGCT